MKNLLMFAIVLVVAGTFSAAQYAIHVGFKPIACATQCCCEQHVPCECHDCPLGK